MDIEKEEVEDSDDEEEIEEDANMIDVVAEQANVSREQAREALVAERFDLVNAIMRLTMSEEFKAESERLEEEVLGQIIGMTYSQAIFHNCVLLLMRLGS
jgi:hypothetical protein